MDSRVDLNYDVVHARCAGSLVMKKWSLMGRSRMVGVMLLAMGLGLIVFTQAMSRFTPRTAHQTSDARHSTLSVPQAHSPFIVGPGVAQQDDVGREDLVWPDRTRIIAALPPGLIPVALSPGGETLMSVRGRDPKQARLEAWPEM